MATEATDAMNPQTHSFEAEIQQLLNIVVHSLYTEREIFVRELVSNAADALEKARHEVLLREDVEGRDAELVIRIVTDKEGRRFSIVDNGIGMSREELVENLGRIAHSGTREFLARAAEAKQDAGSVNLIGQFGVGFYSAFMAAERVVVTTRSIEPGSEGWRWESDGAGTYTVSEAPGAERGTRIEVHLKEDAGEFAEAGRIKDLIRRFSNFVPFPIEVDGERVNTVQAIWTRNKSEITGEEYTEFYKFIANAWDEPLMHQHFSADAPLAIRALLFVPKSNPEAMGFGRTEPGVDLYCRRVLIEKRPEKFLPEWMRFVRGVVDSDDLPLNISRETLQDSALVKKLSRVITGRFLRFLDEQAKKEPETFKTFFETFGRFLKEGAALDHEHRGELAKLLRFETSRTEPGETVPLSDYVGRMKEDQTDIYYINGASREAIESGPYIEGFRARDIEVVYTFDQLDDFVFDQMGEFDGKKLKSADTGDLDLGEVGGEGEVLSREEAEALAGWMKGRLGDRIGSVRTSKRLVDNPAMVTMEGGMTASMQRLMAAMSKDAPPMGGAMALEINPRHPVIRRLAALRTEDEGLAGELAEQLADNALLAAGMLADPRAMIARLNRLVEKAAGVSG